MAITEVLWITIVPLLEKQHYSQDTASLCVRGPVTTEYLFQYLLYIYFSIHILFVMIL